MNSLIEFKMVSKTYKSGLFKKKVQAVNELNLKVKQGEVFGLIGPNGAGKSSTIRMLLGLTRADSGAILFNGKSGNAGIRADVGYLPENPYLYDYLTLDELLVFCGKTSGLDSADIKRRGEDLMSKLNLLDVQKRPLRTFSKGMLQKAGICFALLHDPSVVVLDEPMSGLDPIGRKMVFDLVMELKQQEKTIFFCSHILNDVERLCDRIGLMNKGVLARELTRDDLLQKDGNTVFLKTSEIDLVQQRELASLGASFRLEGDVPLLAISGKGYFSVSKYLEENRINILGCQSEWITLEDYFMKIVKEQNQ